MTWGSYILLWPVKQSDVVMKILRSWCFNEWTGGSYQEDEVAGFCTVVVSWFPYLQLCLFGFHFFKRNWVHVLCHRYKCVGSLPPLIQVQFPCYKLRDSTERGRDGGCRWGKGGDPTSVLTMWVGKDGEGQARPRMPTPAEWEQWYSRGKRASGPEAWSLLLCIGRGWGSVGHDYDSGLLSFQKTHSYVLEMFTSCWMFSKWDWMCDFDSM